MWLPLPRASYSIRREGRPVEEVVIEGEDQIQLMIENFSRAVLDNQPLTPPPEEAIKTLRVLDALEKSARDQKPMDV
jgi:predicted dehydrogenase